ILNDRPFRSVFDPRSCISECLHYTQSFQSFRFSLLRSLRGGLVSQCIGQVVQLQTHQQFLHCISTHFGDKFIRIFVVQCLILFRQRIQNFKILFFCKQIHLAHAVFLFHSRLNDHIPLIVNNRLQIFGRQSEQISDFIGQSSEKPDVHHRNDQLDVTHSFPPYFFLCHFYSASITDDPLVSDSFIFSTVTLIILDRSENSFTEQTVPFGLI